MTQVFPTQLYLLLLDNNEQIPQHTFLASRTIAQAVSPWLPILADQV
jgi:hypothetical protein